jgi:hypothetical protein
MAEAVKQRGDSRATGGGVAKRPRDEAVGDPHPAKAAALSASASSERAEDPAPMRSPMDVKKSMAEDDPAGFVLRFLKRLLKLWRAQLLSVPEGERRSYEFREQRRSFDQARRHIQPFLEQCDCDEADPDVLEHVKKMVLFQLDRRYREAGQQYFDLSIGKSPWPIGVGSFGIHERGSRTRIRSDRITHLMDDDAKRLYITATKALLTKCQELYPPSAPSERALF